MEDISLLSTEDKTTHESRTEALAAKYTGFLSANNSRHKNSDAPRVGPLSLVALLINENVLDPCGAVKWRRMGAPGDARMMVYGGTPPVIDRCQKSQGSMWVTFVVAVGMTSAVGSVGIQSEDPAAKIRQYISKMSTGKKTTHM